MRESDLLEHIFQTSKALRRSDLVVIGPGDDMAMINLAGRRLLAGVDQLIDGRHVRLAVTPIHLVGRKAIARSLSDIAAMAARPVATLVAAALPPDFGVDRANQLFDSMRAVAEQYNAPIIGGDIAFHSDPSKPLVCSATVLAEPSATGPITRSGARPGDIVFVTGLLGGSLHPNGLGRHLTFEPRIDVALKLASTLGDDLHAMIDISDGLGRDASHIAERSNVQVTIDAARIPCNDDCDWRRALSDGEDYELCFAAAPNANVPGQIGGVQVTAVGEVRPAPGRASPDRARVVVQDGNRQLKADDLGWEHSSES
ncbi:MAG: thiamine-phosphate kinase [Phycisphaerales bacterium]|nr:thiamine-phosphate kinase [Phycisphaerales bacterium]MCI0631358.1 thiamine-phosphate kinase [Phycisphaerales bacterium]MCI0675503.1 thiamine-phosphate kinase [Phycisphaerales bacterium]